MQLLIDFGNTRIKWGLLENGNLQYGGDARYQSQAIEELFDNWWDDLPTPRAVLCASVAAPEFDQHLDHWCEQHWQKPVNRLQSVARQLGVTNAYAEPQTLGSDRWAAMIAAHHLSSHHVGVIDCGTAITIDLLRADGTHQGGYIVPGLWTMQQCLLERAKGISSEPSLVDRVDPGDTSASCIGRGALRSVTALIDRLMNDLPQQYDQRLDWLLTGGDAKLVQAHLHQSCRMVPDLVLQGLARVAQGNE